MPGKTLIHHCSRMYSTPFDHHEAPLRRWRLGAEAEERQAGYLQDDRADIEGDLHDHRAEGVGQDVAQDDGRARTPIVLAAST